MDVHATKRGNRVDGDHSAEMATESFAFAISDVLIEDACSGSFTESGRTLPKFNPMRARRSVGKDMIRCMEYRGGERRVTDVVNVTYGIVFETC